MAIKKFKNKSFSLLDKNDIGKKYQFICIINSIKQTSGPTVFTLNDGTALFKATGFLSPGKRAYPEVEAQDCIEVVIQIKQRHNKLEGEILKLNKVDNRLCDDLKKKLRENIASKGKNFLIESEILEKLRPDMVKAAEMIRSAVFDKHPVLIKHHADCDGYCAAIALERAILPIIEKIASRERSSYRFFSRSPSTSPFYEYSDALRDLSYILETQDKYDEKLPLIILTDLGDIEENITSLKRLKQHDIKIILIDHHKPHSKKHLKKLKQITDIYINPYDYGFDSSFVTGMICTELAVLINKDVKNIKFLPALAGTGDKSNIKEFEKYVKLSEYTRNSLKKYAKAIDYETYFLRFQESRPLVDELFSPEKNQEIIDYIFSLYKKKMDEAKKAVAYYVKSVTIDSIRLIIIDCEKISAYNDYPPSGKIVRLAHEQYDDKKKITLGLLPDSIIFRVDGVKEFDVNKTVDDLKKKMPRAMIKGGGHEFAGALKFVKAAHKEVLNYVEKKIRLIQQKTI
ncbi:hypothetical protein GF327_09345 [Candidatus Woesearchaeota archaeon]|nr:hypothetical protein [Candidatus Woesearchaeota archaeon]